MWLIRYTTTSTFHLQYNQFMRLRCLPIKTNHAGLKEGKRYPSMWEFFHMQHCILCCRRERVYLTCIFLNSMLLVLTLKIFLLRITLTFVYGGREGWAGIEFMFKRCDNSRSLSRYIKPREERFAEQMVAKSDVQSRYAACLCIHPVQC